MVVLNTLLGILILTLLTTLLSVACHIMGWFVQRMFKGFFNTLPSILVGFLTAWILSVAIFVSHEMGAVFLSYFGVK
jgi:hypothetical protein